MTEQEWLECDDPTPMVEFLRDKASDRKLRLFACACVRRVRHLLTEERSREAVEVAERHADALASDGELRAACSLAEIARDRLWRTSILPGQQLPPKATRRASAAAAAATQAAGEICVEAVRSIAEDSSWSLGEARAAEKAAQSTHFRDVFSKPFRLAATAWLTPTVVSLAETIYADRAFDRLPILADALEDAGCADGDILTHCRQPGEHVRGCWVVDLILGKS